jgi:hypothetical protein
MIAPHDGPAALARLPTRAGRMQTASHAVLDATDGSFDDASLRSGPAVNEGQILLFDCPLSTIWRRMRGAFACKGCAEPRSSLWAGCAEQHPCVHARPATEGRPKTGCGPVLVGADV